MSNARILQGHVVDVLRDLPDESVNCLVTSPPYWGLRDYGVAPQVWGGSAGCRHERWGDERTAERHPFSVDMVNARGGSMGKSKREGEGSVSRGRFCADCGAWRGSLGLEPTADLYVQHLVGIFREVRRVLRKDGTLWLVLGDSYSASPKGNLNGQDKSGLTSTRTQEISPVGVNKLVSNLKPKDLVGIPWRVAFALQSDGWYLRSDIIWEKRNVMPESVTDRPTKSHEYLFLLTKSRRYYYDAAAIAEPLESAPDSWGRHSSKDPGLAAVDPRPMFGQARDGRDGTNWGNRATRNKRTVWTIPTSPFHEAHFAVFPEALVLPCILAGCPVDGTVLDPFCGSGTTGIVAVANGRKFIGIELNPKYAEMSERRIQSEIPLLVTR